MKNSKSLILTSIISLLLFAIILFLVLSNKTIGLDNSVNSAIQNIQTPILTKIAEMLGVIFSTSVLVAVILIVGLYHWIKKSKKDALFSVLTISFGAGMVFIIKEIVQRARPINMLISETGFSFPSGHATMSIIFLGIMVYLTFKNTKSKNLEQTTTIISALLVLIIGFSRLIINVHWFTDILAGFALGVFILTFSILLREKI